MSYETTRFTYFSILLFLLTVFIAFQANASDSDTYNFYFQKAPGPMTVNQGGASSAPTEKAPSAEAPAAAPTVAAGVAPPAANPAQPVAGATAAKAEAPRGVNDYNPFQLTLLYGTMRERVTSDTLKGYGGAISYFFTRRIGIGGGVMFGGTTEKYQEINFDNNNSKRDVNKRNTRTQWFAQLTFYPFRSGFIEGGTIDFGLVTGVLGFERKKEHEYSLPFKTDEAKYQKRVFDIYAGPSISFNFTKSIALLAEAHFTPAARSNEYLAGAKFMF